MALIVCEDCDGKVSTRADKCPHCGAPVELKQQEPQLNSSVVPPVLTPKPTQEDNLIPEASPKSANTPKTPQTQIPDRVRAKIAQQLSIGVSPEKIVQQLIDVGYDSLGAKHAVQECSKDVGNRDEPRAAERHKNEPSRVDIRPARREYPVWLRWCVFLIYAASGMGAGVSCLAQKPLWTPLLCAASAMACLVVGGLITPRTFADYLAMALGSVVFTFEMMKQGAGCFGMLGAGVGLFLSASIGGVIGGGLAGVLAGLVIGCAGGLFICLGCFVILAWEM